MQDSIKYPENKKGWGCGVVQVIEYLPGKHEALRSNSRYCQMIDGWMDG
jgi:hypothetical protein